ncbi:MAG: ATP-binding cassette domain-containing protein [Dehalococcoidia bacterium]|nr:ATP-binding cassette domain-containing protein [Dehalococcoidia bacterium]
MTKNIVEVSNLVKSYNGLTAVNGVNFAIRQGEIFGLLGPNGAGKTTTISMLTCLLVPTSGTANIAGHDIVSEAKTVKGIIGLVPQDLAVYPQLSARDNLLFFGRIYGLKGQQLRQRVDALLELVGLYERANDLVNNFSGGMKRRVNIAAGLLHQPQVLFLDEPTVGVDPQSRNFIFDNMELLNRQGMTIIYTTHYMEEAERLCHRIAIIDRGQIMALDTPKALINSLGGGIIRLGLPENTKKTFMADLKKLPAVKNISRQENVLSVQTRHSQEALAQIIQLLNTARITITTLEILEPNLESVFLHLTGRRLRD